MFEETLNTKIYTPNEFSDDPDESQSDDLGEDLDELEDEEDDEDGEESDDTEE